MIKVKMSGELRILRDMGVTCGASCGISDKSELLAWAKRYAKMIKSHDKPKKKKLSVTASKSLSLKKENLLKSLA